MTTLPIPKERTLYLNTQVDQYSIGDLTEDILNINEDDDHLSKLYGLYGLSYDANPIKIFIDSYGGDVYQALGLIGVMENSITPIHTFVTGCAMSAGFLILMVGHQRFAYQYSTLMYHQLGAGTWGRLQDMEDELKEYKRLNKILMDLTIQKTKLSRKKLKEIHDSKLDWHITSTEALELGIIDKIL